MYSLIVLLVERGQLEMKKPAKTPRKKASQLFIPEELSERLRYEAYTENKSKSSIVTEALQEYFHRRDYAQETA
jgi:predicted HicB family RNase H-like nuclease